MFKLVVILLLISSLVTLLVIIAALLKANSPIAFTFALLMSNALIWNAGFLAEVISPTLKGKLFWADIQFIGISILPVAWFALTFLTTGKSLPSLKIFSFVSLIPLLSIILIWTNQYHHLFRIEPSLLIENVPFPILQNDYGIYFYAIHVPYSYLLFAVSLFILIKFYLNAPNIYRRQSIILAVSLIVPLIVDLFYVIGITPIPYFNFTCIFFTLSGILLNFSIEKNNFLDIRPLAFEKAIDAIEIGIIALDSSDRISYLNPAIEKITGVSNNKNAGKDAKEIFPDFSELFAPDFRKTELTLFDDNVEKNYEVQKSTIKQRKNNVVGQIITFHDISEKTKLLKMTEKLALTDTLTNALNRRALLLHGEQEIQRAIRYDRSLSMILFDIDNFKHINDTYGHIGGDQILKLIVSIIQKIIRKNDFIFRYGGDEFVILLVETNLAQAIETGERIRKELANFTTNDTSIEINKVSISLGITQYSSSDTLDNFIQRADQALYKAKSAGKNQSVSI